MSTVWAGLPREDHGHFVGDHACTGVPVPRRRDGHGRVEELVGLYRAHQVAVVVGLLHGLRGWVAAFEFIFIDVHILVFYQFKQLRGAATQ